MDRFEKQEQLKRDLAATGGLVVAFSGGVDSSYLLKVAHEVLGDRVLAVTARSSTYPEREYREAVAFCKTYGIPHRTVVSEELDVEGIADNPPDRCYLCKRELFTKLAAVAREAGTAGAGKAADGVGTRRVRAACAGRGALIDVDALRARVLEAAWAGQAYDGTRSSGAAHRVSRAAAIAEGAGGHPLCQHV